MKKDKKKFEVKKLAKVILDHKRDIAIAAGTIGAMILTKKIGKILFIKHNRYNFDVGWRENTDEIGFRISSTDIFGLKHSPLFTYWSVENVRDIVEHINIAIHEADSTEV